MASNEFVSIRTSRIEKEFNLISHRQELEEYTITREETSLGLLIRVQVPLSLVSQALVSFECFDKHTGEEEKQPGDFKPESKPNTDSVEQVTEHKTGPAPAEDSKKFCFCIFLDQQYPFSSPQVTCETRFTNVIDLFDGRDIYPEVMSGEEWRVAKNLHDIMIALPEFIENTKQLED